MVLKDINRPIVFALLAFMLISPVFASAHSFEWGVDVGDEFTYALQRKVLDSAYAIHLPYWMNFVIPIDAGTLFVATITELEEIPDTITLSDYLPLSHASLSLENDSSNLLADSTAFAILIGDWEYHGEFLNFSLLDPSKITDTETEWGVIEEASVSYEGRIYNYYYEWRYEKTQGTLVYSRYRVETLGTNLIDVIVSQWEEGDPTYLPPEIQTSDMLIWAIAGVVGIIVAFLAYRWVKTPRGLAAELGR